MLLTVEGSVRGSRGRRPHQLCVQVEGQVFYEFCASSNLVKTHTHTHQKGSKATPVCLCCHWWGGSGGWGVGSHQLQLPAISRVNDLQPEMKTPELLG